MYMLSNKVKSFVVLIQIFKFRHFRVSAAVFEAKNFNEIKKLNFIIMSGFFGFSKDFHVNEIEEKFSVDNSQGKLTQNF